MIFTKLFSLSRIRSELLTPTRVFSKFLLDAVYSVTTINFRDLALKERAVFVWDSRANPVTFDFVYTLFWISNQFSLVGFSKFDLIIYKAAATKSMIYKGYDKIVSHRETINRIDNIILSLARLHSSVANIKLVESLSEFQADLRDPSAYILPRYYSKCYSPSTCCYSEIFKLWQDLKPHDSRIPLLKVPANLDLISCFRPEDAPLINKFIIHDSLFPEFVVLTLRDYGFATERNTSQHDIDTAFRFASSLNALLVIIPDDISKLPNYILPDESVLCEAARLTLKIRVLLYSSSVVNLSRTCGPMSLCYFINSAKSITFGFGAGGKQGDLKVYKDVYKFIPGSQPFICQNGYLFWAHDRPADSYDENDLLNALKLIS